jgi:hypothetical protein
MSEFLKGQFLIAGYRLRDDNFFKSVVLIVEHNAQGAMGVIVNRPSDETVSETLAGHFDLPETGDVVYLGGPVEPAALFIVHDGGVDEPDEPEIVPGIYVASSAETFEKIVRGAAEEVKKLCSTTTRTPSGKSRSIPSTPSTVCSRIPKSARSGTDPCMRSSSSASPPPATRASSSSTAPKAR